MTSKQMIKLLKKNGFVCLRQNGSHMLFVNKFTGRTTIVPFHTKDLPMGTEQKILKDAGLK